ncbi:MAG: F0F1 ATP synthase subunit A [Thalassospira sp.]|uniref:F0F1 ATP synthase subunit A n=1 Tax=Thalassospira sp. TaxID=1912094 RepID=UPI0032EF8870
MAGPLEQFKIEPLVDLSVAGVDISFTNSALWMVIAAVFETGFMTLSMRRGSLVPGRWQGSAEVMYEFVANMLKDNVGSEGRKYFPFIFTLFMFVLFGNLLGMIPHSFTFTSHFAVNFALALVIFIGVTIIGFVRHGTHYFRMFFPEGAPIATALILIPIEIISYFSRPFSLAMRLFANMTVGHIMLKVVGGFVGLIGILGVLPFALLTGITVLEFGIAALQAYVFTILTCIYLHDAIHMH